MGAEAMKKYVVVLSADERALLTAFTHKGVASARELRRARILVVSAGGWRDVDVAAAVGCCETTVEAIRKRGVEEGVTAALHERSRPGGTPLLDADAEATLIALACTEGPRGRGTWTMQLLADRLVALGVVPAISAETVRRTLKKTISNPGNGTSGASPS
jgi:transposase